MGDTNSSLSSQDLVELVGTAGCPRLIDVRRATAFAEAEDVLPTAVWRDHTAAEVWGADLASDQEIVVYCVHGHQVSQSAAALLRQVGVAARYLDGGIEGYRAAGGPLTKRVALAGQEDDQPTRWVTRERPKIDRVACPWLIRRFVDREAAIYFVEPDWVEAAAVELKAIPFDIPEVAFSHEGERCSFDAFIKAFGLAHPALERVARIVRGADTGHLELAPEAAGLLAFSLGLSAIEGDDQAMMERGFLIYDALYGWARHAADESHGWPPAPSTQIPTQVSP